MTTPPIPSGNQRAADATTNAAVAAGGSVEAGPKQNYRVINLPQEA